MNGSSSGQPLRPVRIAPLQRAWLREIGVDRPWLPESPKSPPGDHAANPHSAGEASPGAAPSRPASVRQPGPSAASPASGFRGAAAQAEPAAGLHGAAAQGEPAARFRQAAAQAKPASEGRQDAAQRAAVSGAREAAAQAAGGGPGIAALAAAADRPAVGSADLDQLREQVVACTACGLCAGRKQAVFGDGARPARWMVVGEAPGEQEDRQGLPFVGRSGQLLDAMLASIGMSRQRDVYIANVIKCRPPANRNPKPEEIAACSPYLMRQIDLLRPERILVLGRFAAQTLLGTDAAIGSLRGRMHRLPAGGREIPVVVSYHPAYLLRSPGEKARAWQDLQLAARQG